MIISHFNNSDVDSDTYLNLYVKLKEAIGISEEYDKNEKISGIYYIYDSENTLIYIGQSKNIASRITTHIRGKYRYSHKIIIERIDVSELDNVERFMIDNLAPIDNVLVNEKYDIESTEWAEQFLALDDNNKEYFDFSDILNFPINEPRTIIYPNRMIITSIDILPELYGLLSALDTVDSKSVDSIIDAIRKAR